MQEGVEIKAVEVLLQRGVPIDVAPPLLFWWWKPRVYAPTAGNMVRMSELYLKTGISDDNLDDVGLLEAMSIAKRHTYTICRAIAICMFRGYWMPKIMNRVVGWWLMQKLSQKDIAGITLTLMSFSGTADFLSTTRFLRGMRITSPNLGQRKKRS